ncbi:hypothetical protein BJ165DRAFT_1340079, partial [Panaeolus papilionaceus]
CVAEIFNDGLPRAVCAERTRSFGLIYTLITTQCLCGFVLSLVLFGLAPFFARIFAPMEIQEVSANVLSIWAFHATPWLVMTAVTNGVRAYGDSFYPGVEQKFPSIFGFVASSVAGKCVTVSSSYAPLSSPYLTLFLSNYSQFGACLSILFFILYTRMRLTPSEYRSIRWFSCAHFMELYNVGQWTFLESAMRNAVYMWQMHDITSLGLEYALVWATFGVVRRITVDIPVRSLELTTNTFVGNNWRVYLERKKTGSRDLTSWCEIRELTSPALKSTIVALLLTVPLVIWVTLAGAKQIARLYGNEDVASMVAEMWTVVGVGVVLWSASVQMGSVMMVVAPTWYSVQSLAFTAVYSLPCAIALSAVKNNFDAGQLWGFYKWMVGGSYVIETLFIAITSGVWVAKMRGRALVTM